MGKLNLGTYQFNDQISVTDPCYGEDDDLWYRMNDIKVEPGEYDCTAFIFDKRCARLMICKRGYDQSKLNYKEIGKIGVDGGMAGFFVNRNDYMKDPDAWSNFLNAVKKPQKAWKLKEGVVSESGYGDGSYSVFAAENSKGTVVSMYIEFIKYLSYEGLDEATALEGNDR